MRNEQTRLKGSEREGRREKKREVYIHLVHAQGSICGVGGDGVDRTDGLHDSVKV